MSYTDDQRESRPKELSDEKLWKTFVIEFSLHSKTFSENEIFGNIIIEPKDARRLIKHFLFFAGEPLETRPGEPLEIRPSEPLEIRPGELLEIRPGEPFEIIPDATRISLFSFKPTKNNLPIYIEAIPKDRKFRSIKKESKRQLKILPKSSALTPTVTFTWISSNASPKKNVPVVVIRWFNTDDKIGQTYVVCLDGKEIHYIRETSKKHVFQVCIHNLQPDSKHDVQIKARYNNIVPLYESQKVSFTVPANQRKDREQKYGIKVKTGEKTSASDDSSDMNDEDEAYRKRKTYPPRENNPSPRRTLIDLRKLRDQSEKQRIDDATVTILSCGCKGPHQVFPGLEHYFQMSTNEPSSYIENHTYVQSRRSIHSGIENSDERDDDDDVVFVNQYS